MPIPIPKFLTQREKDPKFTTDNYWARFQYNIISNIKTKPDKLLDKQKKVAASSSTATQLTADLNLYLEVLKSSFLEALGDEAIYEIQQRNPKQKVYQQSVDWIEVKWEECSQSSRNVTENLVELWNETRPKDLSILLQVGARVAQCKLDSMNLEEVEEHIQIAAFLSSVNEPKQAKSLWQKKDTKNGLHEYIRSTAEAEKELERKQNATKRRKPLKRQTTQARSRTILLEK